MIALPIRTGIDSEAAPLYEWRGWCSCFAGGGRRGGLASPQENMAGNLGRGGPRRNGRPPPNPGGGPGL